MPRAVLLSNENILPNLNFELRYDTSLDLCMVVASAMVRLERSAGVFDVTSGMDALLMQSKFPRNYQ